MNAILSLLPDIAAHVAAEHPTALDWVGMEHIALPIQFGSHETIAFADAGVDLIDPEAKGIHMSRIYLALHALSKQSLTPLLLRELLNAMLVSHHDLSSKAHVKLQFDYLARREALRSDQFGWQHYPITIEAIFLETPFSEQQCPEKQLTVQLSVDVAYASTCPCSAALTRQLNVEAFAKTFSDSATLDKQTILNWLGSPQGLAGVPHAQRSNAQVRVTLAADCAELPVDALIDRIESALGTAVQTAVKREDEQAFAALMAENLMFCEDAARRVQAVLNPWPAITAYDIAVHHHESLHAHEAVARVSGQPIHADAHCIPTNANYQGE